MTMGDRITATRRPSNNHTDRTTAVIEHSQPRRTDPESGPGRTKVPRPGSGRGIESHPATPSERPG